VLSRRKWKIYWHVAINTCNDLRRWLGKAEAVESGISGISAAEMEQMMKAQEVILKRLGS
jgi:hypothetical protein